MRLATSLSTLSLLILLSFPAASPADILRLNEVLAGPASDWDGSGDFSSRDDEWVEIYNGGLQPVLLASYFLTDGDSLPRYRFSGSLGAARHAVVYGSAATEWERANGFPAFGLSLGNGGDTVMLWQVSGAETLLVDAITYDSHAAAADRAIGRPDDIGAWELYDALNPYNGTGEPAGNGCPPTPGASNFCGTTPARTPTWGRIKSIYR